MNRKRKYRRILLGLLGADLLALGILGYRYLEKNIPDEIYVESGKTAEGKEILHTPFLSLTGDAVQVSGGGSYSLTCSLFGKIPLKEVKITSCEPETLLVSGSTVGIYMETKGVLIIGTGEIISETGEAKEPAKDLVQPGDYIVAFNHQKISTKKELMSDLEELDGDTVSLEIRREDQDISLDLTPVRDAKGSYKLGIWVRDDTQGIGTLTYVESDGSFGALGHGISDVDTGELLNIEDGSLYRAQILGIQKGQKGSPGELSGLIRYETKNIIGTIGTNTENGIYGTYQAKDGDGISLIPMKIGYKQEMETGPASVLTSIDGEVKEYAAEITKINLNDADTNKSFVIRITDQVLLDATGGIVQGMSGSPVIQNGKIVGAVTHVFVQDSAGGYGIFIENMLRENSETER